MKSRNGLITAAMVVAGIRLWMQMRGQTKTPFGEWAIGWGATFFILSLLSEPAPEVATMTAWIIVFADFLHNGTSLTGDISNAITGAEKGQPTFTPAPFTSTPQSSTVKKTP